MQLFQVLRSIETKLIPNGTLKDLISPSQTYLLFRHEVKTIIVMRGSKTSLVTRLIGVKLANEYRKSLLRDYLVYEWDENEIIEKVGNISVQSDGIIYELVNPNLKVHLNEDGQRLLNNEYNVLQIEFPDWDWKANMTMSKLQVFSDQKINAILDQIKSLPPVPDFKLEMILIGNTVYIPFEEIDTFFNQITRQQKFLKLGQLPEGRFFKEGYSSRLIISNRKVRALIYYRPLSQRSELGIIRSPVLAMDNVTKVRDFEVLQKAFQIPNENQK